MKQLTVIFLSVLLLSACNEPEARERKDDIHAYLSNEKDVLEMKHALTKIIGTPSFSSNPYDSIKAHQQEFDFLVNQGDTALIYFLEEFHTSTADGLKEYVMAVVCTEILGHSDPVKEWDTGRNWYNRYISQ